MPSYTRPYMHPSCHPTRGKPVISYAGKPTLATASSKERRWNCLLTNDFWYFANHLRRLYALNACPTPWRPYVPFQSLFPRDYINKSDPRPYERWGYMLPTPLDAPSIQDNPSCRSSQEPGAWSFLPYSRRRRVCYNNEYMLTKMLPRKGQPGRWGDACPSKCRGQKEN